MTVEQARAKLVEQDVARWGETERAACERAHSAKTLGLALNELANRAELDGAPAAEVAALRQAAKLTRSEAAKLRRAAED
jgi:hypothetical protein